MSEEVVAMAEKFNSTAHPNYTEMVATDGRRFIVTGRRNEMPPPGELVVLSKVGGTQWTGGGQKLEPGEWEIT